MSNFIFATVAVMIPGFLFAATGKNIKRAPSSENEKVMICGTSDFSPNVDIHVEFLKDVAIVKIITFGNDVDIAPTNGPRTEVSVQTGKDLLKGNAAIAIVDKSDNSGRLLSLKNGSGYVSIPSGKSNMVFAVTGCKAQ